MEESGLIQERLSKLGRFTRDEKIVAAIFISTAIAWITRGLLWKDFLPVVDDSTIVLIAAITLFLIPSSSVISQRHTTNIKNIDAKGEGTIPDTSPNTIDGSPNQSSDKNNRKMLLDWNTARGQRS